MFLIFYIKQERKGKLSKILTVMKLAKAMKEALHTHKALNQFSWSKVNNNWGN